MKFHYYITGYGWAYLDVEFGDYKPEFPYADAFCGGLEDLLKQIVSILEIDENFLLRSFDIYAENKLNWKIDEEGTHVEFDMAINEQKDKAIVNVIHHFYSEVDKECVYTGEINFNEFVNEVIISCDEILKEYGIIGYFNNSMDMVEFPITYYLLIKNYLHRTMEKIEYVNKKFPHYNNGEETDLFKTDIDEELGLIKKMGTSFNKR